MEVAACGWFGNLIDEKFRLPVIYLWLLLGYVRFTKNVIKEKVIDCVMGLYIVPKLLIINHLSDPFKHFSLILAIFTQSGQLLEELLFFWGQFTVSEIFHLADRTVNLKKKFVYCWIVYLSFLTALVWFEALFQVVYLGLTLFGHIIRTEKGFVEERILALAVNQGYQLFGIDSLWVFAIFL